MRNADTTCYARFQLLDKRKEIGISSAAQLSARQYCRKTAAKASHRQCGLVLKANIRKEGEAHAAATSATTAPACTPQAQPPHARRLTRLASPFPASDDTVRPSLATLTQDQVSGSAFARDFVPSLDEVAPGINFRHPIPLGADTVNTFAAKEKTDLEEALEDERKEKEVRERKAASAKGYFGRFFGHFFVSDGDASEGSPKPARKQPAGPTPP